MGMQVVLVGAGRDGEFQNPYYLILETRLTHAPLLGALVSRGNSDI